NSWILWRKGQQLLKPPDTNVRGMMVRRLRRSASPIFAMSIPSITIQPLVGSTNLKNDKASVLFPDPVRPRIPIYDLSVRFCSQQNVKTLCLLSRMYFEV